MSEKLRWLEQWLRGERFEAFARTLFPPRVRDFSAFTLIELLVVIAIIGIL